MTLKKLLSLLLVITTLLSVIVACANGSDNETESNTTGGNTVVMPTDTDEDTYTDTDTDSETDTETETETDTETETETDKEPEELPPEVLSKTPPEDIVTAIASNVTHLNATTECKMVILNDHKIEDVLKAFTDEDFTVANVHNIEGAKFDTFVLSKTPYLVTIYAYHSGEIRIMWEEGKNNAAGYLLSNSETGKDGGTITNIGIDRQGCTDNPMIGLCVVTKLSDGSVDTRLINKNV